MQDRASPALQPPRVAFIDLNRRDHNTYRVFFEDGTPSISAVVDDFGGLRTLDADPWEVRHHQWFCSVQDEHEATDPSESFEAYLDFQYPDRHRPVMSLARPAPIEAVLDRDPVDSWVAATIQIGRDDRSIDAPMYEIVLPSDSLQLTHGQAAALLAALLELVQPCAPGLAS